MPRGFFTQSAVVLFDRAPSLEIVERALAAFAPTRRAAGTEPSWLSGGTELVIRMRPEQNGVALVDVVGERWPDGMGDPKTETDLFGAWSMGGFGPLAFPGGLARAASHAVAYPEASDVVEAHRAFVRVRTTYVLGAGPSTKTRPDDWDALFETLFAAKVARAILESEGALAFYDPNAEVILPAAEMDAVLAHAKETATAPTELFAHVRLFRVGDAAGWTLMDTVGLDRFFLPDAEIAFEGHVDPNDAAAFLRGVILHQLEHGDVLAEGNTVDGPGGIYVARRKERGLADPPRAVVRLVPADAELPSGL